CVALHERIKVRHPHPNHPVATVPAGVGIAEHIVQLGDVVTTARQGTLLVARSAPATHNRAETACTLEPPHARAALTSAPASTSPASASTCWTAELPVA